MLSAAVLAAFAALYVGITQGAPSILSFGVKPSIVNLGYARYRGNLSYPDTVAYLGLPYAEPPIGERRYRAPLSLNLTRISEEAGGKVIDATEYPDFCIQETTGGAQRFLAYKLFAC